MQNLNSLLRVRYNESNLINVNRYILKPHARNYRNVTATLSKLNHPCIAISFLALSIKIEIKISVLIQTCVHTIWDAWQMYSGTSLNVSLQIKRKKESGLLKIYKMTWTNERTALYVWLSITFEPFDPIWMEFAKLIGCSIKIYLLVRIFKSAKGKLRCRGPKGVNKINKSNIT